MCRCVVMGVEGVVMSVEGVVMGVEVWLGCRGCG